MLMTCWGKSAVGEGKLVAGFMWWLCATGLQGGLLVLVGLVGIVCCSKNWSSLKRCSKRRGMQASRSPEVGRRSDGGGGGGRVFWGVCAGLEEVERWLELRGVIVLYWTSAALVCTTSIVHRVGQNHTQSVYARFFYQKLVHK